MLVKAVGASKGQNPLQKMEPVNFSEVTIEDYFWRPWINTSFNVMDEPIVCTPEDAIGCFLKSGIDILAIEGLVAKK